MNVGIYSLFLWLTFSQISADIDESVCKPTPKAVPPPPPPLAPSYSTTIEWKSLYHNSTVIVQEQVDGINKISSIKILEEGVTSQVIFDTKALQYFVVNKVNSKNKYTCVTHTYSEVFLPINAEGDLWKTTTKQLYEVILKTVLVYNGTTVIRSINVDVWNSCFYVYTQAATVFLKIYFAADGWPMPLAPPNARVPVRIEMKGDQNGTLFHVIGDFVKFVPSPQFDPQELQTPPGTFCPKRINMKQIIYPSKNFATVIERIDVYNKKVTFENIWFDSDRRFVRIDKKSAAGNDEDPEQYIHDFQTGIRYKIDPYLITCTSDVIQIGDDFVKMPAPNGKIQLQSSLEFFNLENSHVQYVGKRTTRSIVCDVWVGYNFNTAVNRNQTIEWYFMEDGWIEASGLSLTPGSLVRYDIWVGEVQNPIVHHVHKLDPSQPQLSVFDISSCYNPSARYHFMIKFAVSGEGSLVDISKSFLADNMQYNLANASMLNPIRISRVTTEHFNEKEFYFTGIIVDKPPYPNLYIYPPPPIPVDLDGAFGFMRGVISTPWVHSVLTSAGQSVLFTSVGITTINYQTEITTTTTQPTTSGTFLIPTLPKTGPTTPLPTPKPPPSLPSTSKSTKNVQTSSHIASRMITRPPATQAPCICPKMTCPAITQKTRTCPTVKCPVVTTHQVPKYPTTSTFTLPRTSRPRPSTTNQIPTNQVTVKASPQKSSSNKGVSSGGAAGIAIAMLIIGIFIGIGILLLYQRHSSSSVLHRQFTNPAYDGGN